MFEGIGTAINLMMWTCAISVPLGMWKLVEIVVWVCKHVHFE